MTKDDLRARLSALSLRISEAQKRLRDQRKWSNVHRLTSGELQARHEFLQSELDDEIQELETHGHHVSMLEASIREWIDSLELANR